MGPDPISLKIAHLHMSFLDSAYQAHGNRINFHSTCPPGNSELAGLLDTLSRRISDWVVSGATP